MLAALAHPYASRHKYFLYKSEEAAPGILAAPVHPALAALVRPCPSPPAALVPLKGGLKRIRPCTSQVQAFEIKPGPG